MSEKSIVEEAIEYFRAERSRSERELTVKEKSHQNTVYQVSELLLISIWKNLLKPVLRWFLPRKLRKLKKEIDVLRDRISQYITAEEELKQGKYETAISLLDETINRLPATIPTTSTGSNINGTTQTQIRNERFYYLLELKRKLVSLQEVEAVTTIIQ